MHVALLLQATKLQTMCVSLYRKSKRTSEVTWPNKARDTLTSLL
jgi:hypothetical protein